MKPQSITESILREIDEYRYELSFETERLEMLKETKLKPYYESEKQRVIDQGGDFQKIVVNGIYLQEVKRPTYTWKPTFRKKLIDMRIAHHVLKKGNQLNKRFDLEDFEVPGNPENKWIHVYHRKSMEQKQSEQERLEIEVNQWENATPEELIERYIRYKKKCDIKKSRYKADKERLLKAMMEEQIDSIEGYTLKDEPSSYDFESMWGVILEETLVLATNGNIYVDLLGSKNEVIDINPEELYDVMEIKKRFGQKKKEELAAILGENFYYIEAKREERDILSRFPISTAAVDELIDAGELDNNTLEKERYVENEEDYNLTFEIITEDDAIKRYEVFAQNDMQKKLERSGYFDKQ